MLSSDRLNPVVIEQIINVLRMNSGRFVYILLLCRILADFGMPVFCRQIYKPFDRESRNYFENGVFIEHYLAYLREQGLVEINGFGPCDDRPNTCVRYIVPASTEASAC